MRIVWCSWKDREHPQSGGAELVTDNILKRLVGDGHEVILLTAAYEDTKRFDEYPVVRIGNRFTVYFRVWRYYRKHLRGKADLMIDEMNTIPFFAKWYAGVPTILMVHQLARIIWFHQLPWFIGWIGYLLEPVYLFLLRNQHVITVSNSTKKDLMRHGFKARNIRIISEGIHLDRAHDLNGIKKYRQPTMLSLGAMRAMKRTLDQVKAFEIAKSFRPDLRLKIAGDSNDPYGQKVLEAIKASRYAKDIEYLGRVSSSKKLELMQRAHFITVTSLKEGWGLIVSEAASQGTPAIVYDVDGLRDSVNRGRTGVVTAQNTPASLAGAIAVLLDNPARYHELRRDAWKATKDLTFDYCYRDFVNSVKEFSYV